MPVDLVRLVDRLKKDREEFWLSKTQWKRSKVPKTLVWNSVTFRRSESVTIPATRGVYAFQIKFTSNGIPQHGYLMYVGETGNGNSRETLRSRFLSYFSEMQEEERSLHYTLCKYEEYLHFYYSPIPDRRRNLKTIEAWLCDTLVPPYNVKDFSVENAQSKKSFIMKSIYFPTLRGKFGSWTYYSCLMPLKDLAARVSYASELFKNKGLSDMLQRVLDEERAANIAQYLVKQDARFFNSIVVAVYGGEPQWFAAGRITARNSELELEEIDPVAQESIGFLKLRGDEKLFTLDGQHRLAGIRQAVKEKPALGKEVQSVIFVGHKKNPAGRERTRRLFTTLNKTAKPVSKNDIIALDEDDVMAITARRLVETHPWFMGKRIAFNSTPNLAANDVHALTTIINLYDILTILFSKISPQRAVENMKYYRPDDQELDKYYEIAVSYFTALKTTFPSLGRCLEASDSSVVIKQCRGDFGGDFLFRPIGLTVITEVIAALSKTKTLAKAVEATSQLPLSLSRPPYLEVLWDKRRGMLQGKALARDLLLHMLGQLSKDKSKEVGKKYARALELNSDQWEVALSKLPSIQ